MTEAVADFHTKVCPLLQEELPIGAIDTLVSVSGRSRHEGLVRQGRRQGPKEQGLRLEGTKILLRFVDQKHALIFSDGSLLKTYFFDFLAIEMDSHTASSELCCRNAARAALHSEWAYVA